MTDAPFPRADPSSSADASVPHQASFHPLDEVDETPRSATVAADATPLMCHASPTARLAQVCELRFTLFDFDAYQRELAPLMSLAVQQHDAGLFAAWVHVNLARLKHPERCTFLDERFLDEEFVEFDVREYARFALTAFCEPEAFRRVGVRAPVLRSALCLAGASETDATNWILGDRIGDPPVHLTLSNGEHVGLLDPASTNRALQAATNSLAYLRQPGASQRLLPVRMHQSVRENTPNERSEANGKPQHAASQENGSGRHVVRPPNGNATLSPLASEPPAPTQATATSSHRYFSAKAMRHALEAWCELLDEANEVGVGLLYLYRLGDLEAAEPGSPLAAD